MSTKWKNSKKIEIGLLDKSYFIERFSEGAVGGIPPALLDCSV
jgi:hypothetical protein